MALSDAMLAQALLDYFDQHTEDFETFLLDRAATWRWLCPLAGRCAPQQGPDCFHHLRWGGKDTLAPYVCHKNRRRGAETGAVARFHVSCPVPWDTTTHDNGPSLPCDTEEVENSCRGPQGSTVGPTTRPNMRPHAGSWPLLIQGDTCITHDRGVQRSAQSPSQRKTLCRRMR
jgi:hypothetical protein